MTTRKRMARTSNGVLSGWAEAGKKLKRASPQATMETVIVSM